MANLPTINAFWIGPRIGKMHAACLQSFVRHGHRVVLHTYEPPEDTPKGIELSDASVLLSRDKIVAHRESGSLALASDIFRYELLAANRGIYVDCDCYCVRPVVDDEFVFGRESDAVVATSVLKLPADSPVLTAMRSIATTHGFVPPWESPSRRRRYRLRASLGLPVALSKMSWGTMGPNALTYYTKYFGIMGEAKPSDVHYPVSFHQAELLRDPGVRLEHLTTPRTCVVHLWNEIQRKTPGSPPQGSPLDEIVMSLEI